MSSTLLAVKFFVPTPRPALTERPHLLERFSAGLVCPLTLISAPAGFGKSTLLSARLVQHSASGKLAAQMDVFCWLSLDAADNHPARFWTYFVAALQTGVTKWQAERRADPHLNLDDLREYLQSDPPPSIPTVLDELINAISGSPERILLVLDDYHVIQTPEIHEQMTYLLDHQPPNLHLVVSTRADPPLPITRLRARGQLNEFRAADLRFTLSETEEFFKSLAGIAMVGEELSAVQSSTEGWIAGLQMAALALQAVMNEDPDGEAAVLNTKAQQEKIKAFVSSFSGKHLYILDYLTDEVFNRQTTEIQAFLLKTSILERMSAGLCAAVLRDEALLWHEVDDGRDRPAVESQDHTKVVAILDHLEKYNLFLIRLDDERQWFRYHHLFADLLRARLEQNWPGLAPELHQNASHWYAQNGFVDDAIQHALAARDWAWAAQLMEMNVTTYLELGQLVTVLKVDRLAPQRRSAEPPGVVRAGG